jgi:tetratricopeptide (TPR) repeat protein
VLAFSLEPGAITVKRCSIAVVALIGLIAVFSPSAFAGDEPKWIEVHSTHFSVLTDAGDKQGREVTLRMEQMRAVFGQLLLRDKLKMSVPITVVGLKTDAQYAAVAPGRQRTSAGFYVPGADRIYIVLNCSEVEPWRAVAHSLAHYFLNYNYPPAQGWFDEGMAEYFGSIDIGGKGVDIGGDPELMPEWHEDIFESMRRDPNVRQSLTQLLSSPVWLSMTDLFTMKHDGSGIREGTHNTIYYAQSWMVVHYLINKKRMPQVGTYFDLVLNQKVPVEKAMVEAFDLSPSQMEDAVKAYFKSLSNLGIALDQSKNPIADPADVPQPIHFNVPFDADDLGLAVNSVRDSEARAVLGDIMARVPEHHDQAVHDLQQLVADPKDNEDAHRALAWDSIQQKQFDAAEDEMEKCSDLNPRDPWIWYYRSILKYRRAQATRQEVQGLANMMQDLRAVIDWYPEMADAYNMLGMARVEGGGINSALEAQRTAISLAPRNLEYQFNLGQIFVAGKKWDQAREIFTRLKAGPDPRAAAAARQQLDDLATLQKYGIRPQRPGASAAPEGAASSPSSDDSDDEEEAEAPPKPKPAKPGATGPVRFLKGKIVSIDCSKPPEAIVTIISDVTTYKMHASDFKSLAVIGEDEFSCEWKNRPVAVNYRATGKNEGNLVSIEVQ